MKELNGKYFRFPWVGYQSIACQAPAAEFPNRSINEMAQGEQRGKCEMYFFPPVFQCAPCIPNLTSFQTRLYVNDTRSLCGGDRGSHQRLTASTVSTGYIYPMGGERNSTSKARLYNTMPNHCSNLDCLSLNVEEAQYTPIQFNQIQGLTH